MNLLWFRRDLRLHDQLALHAALKQAGPLALVYILEQSPKNPWPLGAASQAWLDQSLSRLQKQINDLGLSLSLFQGDPQNLIPKIVQEHDIKNVFWNRRYEPFNIEVDKKIKLKLQDLGCQVQSFNSHLLFEPWECQNKSQAPYRVYTPFWKAYGAKLGLKAESTLPKIKSQKIVLKDSLKIEQLKLRSSLNWDRGFFDVFTPGEEGAQLALHKFLKGPIKGYADSRNRPDQNGTSSLSAHLAWGEISVRQIWNEVFKKSRNKTKSHYETYLKEIFWREFAYHLLYHFPQTTLKPLNVSFEKFPWRRDKKFYKLWCQGKTGVPFVDAGMRQLWDTGWMHNRVRMVTASFLVKNLMIPWLDGARWFWDTLVDADLASNTMGWQWVAGCGADAAPYFRVFNPQIQGERFDPDGKYVCRWVPELKTSIKPIEPCIDLAQSRQMVLQTWSRFRKTQASK